MTRTQLTVSLAGVALLALFIAPVLRPHLAPAEPATPPVSEPVVVVAAPVEAPPPPAEPVEPARVELVFVLDTTGSMGGLIQGAKDTVWEVVNDFKSQKPTPDVRVGLVAYRDRGDTYVTQVHELTDDLDAIYGALVAMRADGGGDSPESVAKGLLDAVNLQPWTPRGEDRTYRSVFVVGDAPDKHYADEPSPAQIVADARQRDIYVSAIQCGSNHGTDLEFQALAKAGGGTFAAVAQDGAVARIETPLDDDLDRLEGELSATALPWGSTSEKTETQTKIAIIRGSGSSTKASRLSAMAKGAGKKVVTSAGKGDLLDDLKEGDVDLAGVPVSDLPTALAALDPAAREREVNRRIAQRAGIQAAIDTVVAERDAWLTEERAKRTLDLSFDGEVVGSSIEKLKSLGYVE
ncbi:MAG: hypothetical protein ACI8PZ_003274 [Myxococcota bacterium]|jgi:hypothetical protein